MAETGISMRSFAEPLSANRLRQTERNGELLLRKTLVAPSSSSERLIASNGDSKMKSSERLYDRNGHYSHRFEDSASGVYPPALDYRETLDEERGVIENVAVIQPSTSRENDETDIEEELAYSFSKKAFIVPSKSQVLFYLSTSSRLKIHHTGCELQVTDSSDFPLFDIWAESVCCGSPFWVIESYGRRVLMLSEASSAGMSYFLPRGIASIFNKRDRHKVQNVIDWNGDLIGYFVPGEPFLIQDNNRITIARCIRLETERRDCWQCLLEGSDREVARLEHGFLHFAADLSFQLKLLILAAIARAVGQPRLQPSCFPFLR